MKKLFREEYETYNDEAIKISKEIGVEIRKMIDHYCNDCGYYVNEIQHILFDEEYWNQKGEKKEWFGIVLGIFYLDEM